MLKQQRTMARQLIDLQRVTFDGAMRNYIILLDQTGNLYSSFLNQAVWIPEQRRKAFWEWLGRSKRAMEDYSEFVNSAYRGLGNIFGAEDSR